MAVCAVDLTLILAPLCSVPLPVNHHHLLCFFVQSISTHDTRAMQRTRSAAPASDILLTSIMSAFVRLGCIVFLSFSFLVSAVPLNEHNGTQYTTPNAVNNRRTRAIAAVVLAFSSLSMTASLVAFFWVCRMEKQFRHRSVLLCPSDVCAHGSGIGFLCS